ncbi:MAG TPA: peptide-methionine (S)-S-oxide reductase MsrA [Actinomycetes bacterium]|nr:peptide-methionine (S)-S-oxide reductase MsrA [Actinomycetes bacterium]
MLFGRTSATMPAPEQALPGRSEPAFTIPSTHAVLGTPVAGPVPDGMAEAFFGMGCFWGAERRFWQLPGVYSTAVGYQGGTTPNPTYEEACTGMTGHTEAVRVVYDPAVVSYDDLLKVFWETHDPTQGFRQGNDVGTQYRSALYWTDEAQRIAAEASRERYQKALDAVGLGAITTELLPAPTFYYAEGYHQQYLSPTKNPNGYDCHANTGVPYPG